jgi:hypothetical protein
MTLIELKKSLHEKIERCNDIALLRKVYFLLEHGDKLSQIPKEHLLDIIQGEKDFKDGAFLTIEEVEKRYKEYLAN